MLMLVLRDIILIDFSFKGRWSHYCADVSFKGHLFLQMLVFKGRQFYIDVSFKGHWIILMLILRDLSLY